MIVRMSIWFAAILVAGGVFMGCATTGMSANATIAQKMQADALVMNKIKTDVEAACGGQWAPLAPLVASALAVASDPYNAVNDVMAALGAIPALVQDYKAATCVVKTIRDDIHTFFGPAPAATPAAAPASKPTAELQRAAEMGEQVIALLEQGATVTVASVDGSVQMSAETP